MSSISAPREIEGVFLKAVQVFEDADLPFMVVGAFAVMAHGSPRFSKDIDVVLRLPFSERETVELIIEDIVTGEIQERRDPQWGQRLTAPMAGGLELEVFFTPDHPWYENEYRRRVRVAFAGTKIPFISPEDLVLRKLVNTRLRKGQDLADAINVVKVQGDQLDVAYLREHCGVHRICELLEDVLQEAGLGS